MIKKLLMLSGLFGLVLSTSVLAQDHLLITEFAVTPTPGEFVEIYNPTEATIDLSNYYITDATFAGGSTYYYNIVTGTNAGGGGFGDWHARFPDGASIAPGEFQTIALLGDSLFFDSYNVLPTYEMYEDNSNFANDVTDMREALAGSIDNDHAANRNFGTLSTGEVLILYYWDGQSDLVMDVDYLVWQDKAEAVDKTGVSIDGPDADSDPSTYADDTPIADQTVINVDNDEDDNAHDDGMTAQRRLDVEDVEDWGPGGNGITGHNETSENTSWKGGIWSINEPATPGRRAISPKAAADSLTIADVNFIRADDISPTPADAMDDSPFNGQTLTITGMMMNNARDIFLGNRWGSFVQDARGGPWSGFFIIQNDTTSAGVEGTLITSFQPGDIVRVTGVMSEFPTIGNASSITQFSLITNPVTPIEFVDSGTPPTPILLTPADMGFTAAGNSADPALSERWESVLARFETLSVIQNDGTAGSNTMIVGNSEGNLIIDDYFNAVTNAVTNNGGIWLDTEGNNLTPGLVINVTGYIRGGTSGGFVTHNPSTLADIEIAATPPAIANATRVPSAPTSSQGVEVAANITSASSTIASASLFYSVDGGAFQEVALAAIAGDSLGGTIPPQADGSLVEYLIKATDAAGISNTLPTDTTAAKFFYNVRDNGLTVADVQMTPFSNGNSGYVGLPVTITGIVTSDSTDFAFYYIQQGTGPWSGIQINDNVTAVGIGDEVTVTGSVREQFGVTQINLPTNVTINSTGNSVPEPSVVATGDLATGAPTAEQWESVLVQFQNVTVVNEFPDGFAGFGEFTVDDGSGGVRVDDLSFNSGGSFRGQTPSNLVPAPADTAFPLGATIQSLTGLHYFSFGNFKLAPRNDDDVVGLAVSVDGEELVPFTFDLGHNYPNPFNPETTINYQLASRGEVKIQVFNILGQLVRTLVDEVQPAGRFTIQWNGTNDVGARVASGVYVYRMTAPDFVKSQKMLLLK